MEPKARMLEIRLCDYEIRGIGFKIHRNPTLRDFSKVYDYVMEFGAELGLKPRNVHIVAGDQVITDPETIHCFAEETHYGDNTCLDALISVASDDMKFGGFIMGAKQKSTLKEKIIRRGELALGALSIGAGGAFGNLYHVAAGIILMLDYIRQTYDAKKRCIDVKIGPYHKMLDVKHIKGASNYVDQGLVKMHECLGQMIDQVSKLTKVKPKKYKAQGDVFGMGLPTPVEYTEEDMQKYNAFLEQMNKIKI